jgi:hypothetical protein
MSATAAARPMVARLPLSWYRKGGARGPAGGRARPAPRSALAAWRPAGSRGRCSRSRRGRDHVAEREDVGNGRAGWDPPRLPGAHLLDVPAGGAIGQRGGASPPTAGRRPSRNVSPGRRGGSRPRGGAGARRPCPTAGRRSPAEHGLACTSRATSTCATRCGREPLPGRVVRRDPHPSAVTPSVWPTAGSVWRWTRADVEDSTRPARGGAQGAPGYGAASGRSSATPGSLRSSC